MQPHVKELRSPVTDMTRSDLAAIATLVDAHFGVRHAESASITDWHFHVGKWRMTWVWLIPGQEGDPCENRGIRISYAPGDCITEAWQYGRRVTLRESSPPLQETLASLVSLAFGVS